MTNRERETSTSGQPRSNYRETDLEQVVNYYVYDRTGEHIGKVSSIWADQSGEPAFVGVKTSWLMGKTHIVPAHGVSVNPEHELIRLPYAEEDVKNAPSYDPDNDLDSTTQREVFDYYRSRGGQFPEMESRRATEQPRTGQTARAGQETSIPLHEEHIRAGKREVEGGGVRLRKIVRTETVQKPVEIQREDVIIERVPPGHQTPSKEAFKSEDIFIPLRREEAVIEKERRVSGEVRARKTSTTERQTVSGEVRKEDVEVEREPRRKAA
jgi:uncharacterized protein (TIGR02271 family)